MRFKIIALGIFFVFFAILCYFEVPNLIGGFVNKFSDGSAQTAMTNQIFSQLGIPSIDAIMKYMQYSLIGLVLTGFSMIVFGAIAKKTNIQSSSSLFIDSKQKLGDQDNTNFKVIHLLQERLAKGEITSSQYLSLRRILEDET